MRIRRKFIPPKLSVSDGFTRYEAGEMFYQCPACGKFLDVGGYVRITDYEEA